MAKGSRPRRLDDVNRQLSAAWDDVDVAFIDNDANFTFRNGVVDTSAFHADGLHLSASGLNRLLSNLSLPEQKPIDKSQQLRQPSSQRASNRGVRNTRANNEWRVVERSNRQRRTSGQCAKCGETNHVTARCTHPQEVQCRQCGQHVSE